MSNPIPIVESLEQLDLKIENTIRRAIHRYNHDLLQLEQLLQAESQAEGQHFIALAQATDEKATARADELLAETRATIARQRGILHSNLKNITWQTNNQAVKLQKQRKELLTLQRDEPEIEVIIPEKVETQ